MDSTRADVLAYRAVAHDLEAPGTGARVRATGLQDYPPGRTAEPALRLRTGKPSEGMALVHSLRGALHLHNAADIGLFAAALSIEDGHDFSRQSMGPFAEQLTAAGVSFGAALAETASAMRDAVADGSNPTKGELSTIVSPRIDSRLAPWCTTCGVAHVHDHLFRMATLHAGLVVELDPTSPAQFRYRLADRKPVDTDTARAELVRRFLAAFGPATPTHLGAWLGITPAAARRWWKLVDAELSPVSVDGRKHWLHTDDVARFESAPTPSAIRLLPPYDPITELADRSMLVAPEHRRLVWRATANPGIIVAAGEIVGTWRQRRAKSVLQLTIETFTDLSARQLRAAQADAETIAELAGEDSVEITVA